MFAMTPSFLLCISLFFYSCDATFNQINNQPDHCCPLKLEKYVLGEKFPDDTIFVHNDVTGENWAYAVGEKNYYFYMSEDRQHAIDWTMRPPYDCWSYTSVPKSFLVLSNPNKCVYGYERTRYPLQSYHDDSTLSADGRYFYPSIDYVNSLQDNSTNLFAKTGGYIGYHSTNATNGQFYHCPRFGDPLETDSRMGEVLFVDCLQSLLTATSGDDVSFNVNRSNLNAVVRKKVTNFRQVFTNISPTIEMRQTVAITFEIQEKARAVLNATIAKKQCLEKQYKEEKAEKVRTEVHSGSGGFVEIKIEDLWLNKLPSGESFSDDDVYDKIFGRISMSAIKKVAFQSRQGCESDDTGKALEGEVTRTSRYKHEQEVVIPPLKKVTVLATTSPLVGEIPFKIKIRTASAITDSDFVDKAIKFFKLGDGASQNEDGFISEVHSGHLLVDTGYEVQVTASDEDLTCEEIRAIPTLGAGYCKVPSSPWKRIMICSFIGIIIVAVATAVSFVFKFYLIPFRRSRQATPTVVFVNDMPTPGDQEDTGLDNPPPYDKLYN